MSLYPLKFRPKYVEKMWGGQKLQSVLGRALPTNQPIGESWELYDFPPGVVEGSANWVSSVVANGPLAGKTLHELVQRFGRELHGDVPLLATGQFPILIKYLDAREHLSVQVHPDEIYCASHPEAHLKSEAWYVVQNEPAAKLWRGVKAGTGPEQFAAALQSGEVENLLTAIVVKPGKCFYLPSGTVHALGAGIFAAEVQTPSDTTFRVFDFNRIDPSAGTQRKLHIQQALECIRFDQPDPPQPRSHVAGFFTTVSQLVNCPYFKLEKVRMTEGIREPIPYDQPVVWMMLEGQAQVSVEGVTEPVAIGKGDTVLLPATMEKPMIETRSDCVWLEVTFPS